MKDIELGKFKVNPLYIIGGVIVLLIVIFVGISYASPTVQVGDNITVNYTGSFTNGTVFGSSAEGGQPLTFEVGANQVIPGFDQAVIGMKVGQTKTVVLPVNDAYGPVNPELFIVVPIGVFGNQSVTTGTEVTETTVDDQEEVGIVTAVNSTNATVDFNSPLAGHTLVFNITVTSIQK